MQKQINRIDIYINIAWLTLPAFYILYIGIYIILLFLKKNVHFLSLLINVMICVEIDQQIL